MGLCSDMSKTQVVTLPTDSDCPVKFSKQNAVTVKSDSNPPAYWNIYYRCLPLVPGSVRQSLSKQTLSSVTAY